MEDMKLPVNILFQSEEGVVLSDCNQLLPENYAVYEPYEKPRYIKVDISHEKTACKRLPILYAKRSECCGCGACYSVCPCSGKTYLKKHEKEIYDFSYQMTRGGLRKTIPHTGAITMLPDEEGFLYPVVDASICIRCYKCENVCDFK